MMKWIDDPHLGIPYYTFENLEKTGIVTNAFTTRIYRKDGTENHFLQLLMRSQSDPSQVAACKELMMAQFGVDQEHLVPSAQKHTDHIHVVSDADLGPVSNRTPLTAVDGLITDKTGVMLQTFGADCPSVYLVDPVHRAIGLCHSGRKGTQHHIAAVMLRKMADEYGTDPRDVQAAVSPGICASCYEVGPEVADEFVSDYYAFLRENSLDLCDVHEADLVRTGFAKPHLDLFRAISMTLKKAGVPCSNIEISHLCTRCQSDIFFSLRAEGSISNENSALLMLRPEL